jgi:hypothetical protein
MVSSEKDCPVLLALCARLLTNDAGPVGSCYTATIRHTAAIRRPSKRQPTSSISQGAPVHGRRLCSRCSRPGAASMSSPKTVA